MNRVTAPRVTKKSTKLQKTKKSQKISCRTIKTTTKPQKLSQSQSTLLTSPFNINTRSFAINLVNSKTQTPPQSQKLPQTDSEDDLSSEDDGPKEPKVYTVDDFTILPSTVKHLQHLNRDNNNNVPTQVGLRITVDTGGCSGFQYIYTKVTAPQECQVVLDTIQKQLVKLATTAPDTTTKPKLTLTTTTTTNDSLNNSNDQELILDDENNDLYYIKQGQFVVTDDISMGFLQSSQLEYKTELIRSGFMVVNNPNVDLACGCGTSFSKKDKQKNSV